MEFARVAQARIYGKILRSLMIAAGVLQGLLAAVVSTLWPGSLDVASFMIGVLANVLLIAVLSSVIGVRRQVKSSGWILGEREITMTGTGILDTGNGTALQVDWSAIDGVTVARSIIVLWMDRAAGVFIPRNAFASMDEEQNFLDFASKRTAVSVQ